MSTGTTDAYALQRMAMVHWQIARRGVTDPAVLGAMSTVPRERFVDEPMVFLAYEDSALEIGYGQTISQPYIVALMASALQLEPRDKVLEIGTGSGYAAAVLSHLAAQVFTVELIEQLAALAASRLSSLGYTNVRVRHANGSIGWPEAAPFDAISVAAAAPNVPAELLDQLEIGGRLVIPVGPEGHQRLERIVRVDSDRYREETLSSVAFVPLRGSAGWR